MSITIRFIITVFITMTMMTECGYTISISKTKSISMNIPKTMSKT